MTLQEVKTRMGKEKVGSNAAEYTTALETAKFLFLMYETGEDKKLQNQGINRDEPYYGSQVAFYASISILGDLSEIGNKKK